MARQRKKHHFWRNLLILIVLFGIYLYWGNRSIETDEATFTSGALPAGFDGCRIVQLSDLHGKYFGKGNERLYSAVKAAQPEYIFVTGDLVDRKTENPTIYAGEVGAALSAIAPTYYVTGNHEWGHGTKVVEEIKRTLREIRRDGALERDSYRSRETATVSSSRASTIRTATPIRKRRTSLRRRSTPPAATPSGCCSRTATTALRGEYSLLGADLTISGHGHGGIWRFPFVGGVFGTQRNLFPTHTAGFYSDNGASVFVNRGLGNSPRVIPRILNRPQVAVITLERG